MSACSLALASGLVLAPAPVGEESREPTGESPDEAGTGDTKAGQKDEPGAAETKADQVDEPSGESSGDGAEDDFGSDFDFEAYAAGEESGGDDASDSGGAEFERRDVGERAVTAMGGVRLTGAYLHYPDEPLVYPTGDDALVAAVMRFLMDAKIGSHLEFHTNLYLDLSRGPQPGGMGAFATAGSAQSAYRTTYLAWDFWEDGSVAGQAGVDRAHLDLEAGRVTASLGRFPVNYAVTSIFTPNDLFAPFSATAINKMYKPGVDALRVGVSLGALTAIEVVGAMGYGDDDVPAWGRTATLLRTNTVLWNFEWAALGGKVAERWIVGGSLQGAVGPVGLRSEGHAGFPDENGDGARGDDADVHGRVAAGIDVNFPWHNATIGAEYAFFSDGTGDPDEYLQRANTFYPDDLPYMAEHYVGVLGGLELIPILRLGVVGLVNAQDGSGVAGPSLTYNIADEADFVAGVFVPWGEEPSVDMSALIPAFDIGSEFGPMPLVAFLETRFFF